MLFSNATLSEFVKYRQPWNTRSQFAFTMQFLLLIASIKMVPDELQCYCKCSKKKAILLYTLSASYMYYRLLEECIQACSCIQSGFSNGCQH